MKILRPKRRYRVQPAQKAPVVAPITGVTHRFRLKRSGRPHHLFGLEPATQSY